MVGSRREKNIKRRLRVGTPAGEPCPVVESRLAKVELLHAEAGCEATPDGEAVSVAGGSSAATPTGETFALEPTRARRGRRAKQRDAQRAPSAAPLTVKVVRGVTEAALIARASAALSHAPSVVEPECERMSAVDHDAGDAPAVGAIAHPVAEPSSDGWSQVVRPVGKASAGDAEARRPVVEDRAVAEDSDFGRFLRRSREARSLSLEDVARRTRIREHWLERIEASQLDELPAEVFVRGFVRAHARAVGADEQRASRMLSRCLAGRGGAKAVMPSHKADADIEDTAHAVGRVPDDGRRTGVALAVIMLLIAATLAVSMLMRRPVPATGPVSLLDAPSSQPLV